ncbi:MAG: rRNA pseudouridine synthase [Magnetovibrio sp.]|nr:rRNA pseudouridine synthase [Magnetovibrio sp.]
MTEENTNKGERIAKVMARAGLCSRREAERWIAERRVEMNGQVIDTPATLVTDLDTVVVDGKPLPAAQEAMIWRYHKPPGLVTSHNDEQGRPTVFDSLPPQLGRVISVGRLDLNSEGLLLLTNDGGLARELELPSTGWIRTYRVRVFGFITEEMLLELKDGITVDGIRYGAIDARIEKKTGRNTWLIVSLAEGKNREIRRVMEYLNVQVNRLIRQSYGPFRLDKLERGEVQEVPRRQMIDQLGAKLGEAVIPPKTSKTGWAKPKAKPNPKPKGKGKPKPDTKSKPKGKRPGKPQGKPKK